MATIFKKKKKAKAKFLCQVYGYLSIHNFIIFLVLHTFILKIEEYQSDNAGPYVAFPQLLCLSLVCRKALVSQTTLESQGAESSVNDGKTMNM